MGNSVNCESDDVSCSSAFASCRTQRCTSSCIKTVKEAQAVLGPIEDAAQEALKKYLEDNLHIILREHLPAALAAHFETITDDIIESLDIIPPVSPVIPTTPVVPASPVVVATPDAILSQV